MGIITNKIVKRFLGTVGLTRVQGEKMIEKSKSKENDDRSIMTVAELADYLHMSKSTVYSWVQKKKLTCYKLNNRKVYFTKKDVDDFLFNSSNLCEPIDQHATGNDDESRKEEIE